MQKKDNTDNVPRSKRLIRCVSGNRQRGSARSAGGLALAAAAIHKLIANGSFGPEEIEVMKTAYEAALSEVGITDRDDPITDLIAKAIVNVTSTGERDPTR